MADSPTYSRHIPLDRDLRASNRDRDAVGDILRREHLAGRLDIDEYEERYGRCLEAKTYAQLDQLIVDLPAGAEAPAEAAPRAAWAPWAAGTWGWPGRRRALGVPALAWVLLAMVLVALSGEAMLWLPLVLVFFFVVRPLWRSAARCGGWVGPGWRSGCGPWV